MTDRSRIAITVAIALLLGASAYGHMFAIDLPGVLQSVWGSGWLVHGLAIIGVFIVYRWWALLPAIAPTAVGVYVHNMTDYESPWRDEFAGLTADPVIYVVLGLVAVMFQAAILSLGLLARAAWERLRPGRRGDSIPTPA